MTNEPLSKKIKLSENNVEANKEREAETQAAIEKIDELQSELDALNDKASEEILQVIFFNYSSRLFFTTNVLGTTQGLSFAPFAVLHKHSFVSLHSKNELKVFRKKTPKCRKNHKYKKMILWLTRTVCVR